jgi:predicted DNA-binding protein (MmcQ/YjbR family)
MDLPPQTLALIARIEAMPGVTSITAMTMGRAPKPLSRRYKVADKMFAIISLTAEPFVILKCDPHLIEVLKETYSGVGHRSHLDHRHWLCFQLDGDVPTEETNRLTAAAYGLVRATLTKKQQAELARAPLP